jgi:hypothetical protein
MTEPWLSGPIDGVDALLARATSVSEAQMARLCSKSEPDNARYRSRF